MPGISKSVASQLNGLRRENAALTRGQLRQDVKLLVRDMTAVDTEAKRTARRLAGVLNRAFGMFYHPDSGFKLKVGYVVTEDAVKYFLSEDRSRCDPESKADIPPLNRLVEQQRFLSYVGHVDHKGSFRLRHGEGLAFDDRTNRSELRLELESP
jgi:hypothetical protein